MENLLWTFLTSRRVSLNPFVQVFYSNLTSRRVILMQTIGLNPFVQVFYSNETGTALEQLPGQIGLNPFVQVFYSNAYLNDTIVVKDPNVLIPLFRSFILIVQNRLNAHIYIQCLNPFVQVFYSNTDSNPEKYLGAYVLIPLFRSFILIVTRRSHIIASEIASLNPFVQVFYSNWRE